LWNLYKSSKNKIYYKLNMKHILLLSLLVLIVNENLRRLGSFDWRCVYCSIVKRHNELRSKHRVGTLTKFAPLASLAQQTADRCRDIGGLQHSINEYKGQWMGQNLYYAGTTGRDGPTGIQVTDDWYNEINDYDFSSGNSRNGKAVGHFTQLVWKGSKQIGCAYSIGNSGGWTHYYVCCDYFPGGNVIGQYQQNVFPPN